MENRDVIMRLNNHDNVGIALGHLIAKKNYCLVDHDNIILAEVATEENVPFGFKIAIQEIPKGEAIIKYGQEIGKAVISIQIGCMVHIHNLTCDRGYVKEK